MWVKAITRDIRLFLVCPLDKTSKTVMHDTRDLIKTAINKRSYGIQIDNWINIKNYWQLYIQLIFLKRKKFTVVKIIEFKKEIAQNYNNKKESRYWKNENSKKSLRGTNCHDDKLDG